ncbi:MAG: glycosyltransferase family 4 protein [Rhizobiaceae bacterium]
MMQQPKILQVIPALETGGAERTALDIGDAILARGWESIVASAGGRMLDPLIARGNRHVEFPLSSKNPFTIWRNAARLTDLIKRENIDIIHARSRAPAWSALLAARRTGIPFVTTYHGSYNQRSRLKAWYNSVMARADVVIANSGWTGDLIATRNPWAQDRIQVIHRGTDFEHFKPDAVTEDRLTALRDQWSLKGSDVAIVQLARLTGWKGHETVIEAAAKIANDFPNARFILAGDAQGRSDYLQRLQNKIAELGVANSVLLPGHCDDPAAAMALAELVVVASTQAEAFGRAAVEAGALEKPVIVSDIGAVQETVLAEPGVEANQITGWKVTPGNADELAQALRHALQLSPDQRRQIGKIARLHGQKNFSLQQMCEKTLTIYEKLLADSGKNPSPKAQNQ